jgi:hypothetical protein
MGHTRIQMFALAGLFSVGIGVTAVQASPTCQRFVRTYVTVPVRNRVSKTTALAWAKWRVAHPNWKPRPGVARPKYVMTQKELMDKVAFACEAPTTPATTDLLFKPADFDVPPPPVDFPPTEIALVTFPELYPPEVVATPPVAGSPDVPSAPGIFIPPDIPPVSGGAAPRTPFVPVPPPILPTPEPASFFLVILGMAGGWIFWMRRARPIAQ